LATVPDEFEPFFCLSSHENIAQKFYSLLLNLSTIVNKNAWKLDLILVRCKKCKHASRYFWIGL